jgi:hypothetical protein
LDIQHTKAVSEGDRTFLSTPGLSCPQDQS